MHLYWRLGLIVGRMYAPGDNNSAMARRLFRDASVFLMPTTCAGLAKPSSPLWASERNDLRHGPKGDRNALCWRISFYANQCGFGFWERRQRSSMITNISGLVLQKCCGYVSLNGVYVLQQKICRLCHSSPFYKFIPRHVHVDCRTLMKIIYLRDWNDKLEADLKRSGVIICHEYVNRIISCIPSPKLALQFYIWAGEQIGYPPLSSSAAYQITVWYSHKPQLHAFLKILQLLAFPHRRLTPPQVNVLLQGYGWAGMIDRAIKLLRETQGFSDYKSIQCLLHAVIRERRFELVYEIYLEMLKHGTRVDVSCSLLIYGMARDGKWQYADDLMQEMVKKGCIPDATAYNMLIISLSAEDQLVRACELLHDMLDGNIIPESKTLHVVLERLRDTSQEEQAVKLIDAMRTHGHDVDPTLYQFFGGSMEEDAQQCDDIWSEGM